MTRLNKGTKKYESALWTWNNTFKGYNLFQAYKSRVSDEKYDTFDKIAKRAFDTKGYNYDLKVVASSSWFYSTMYSFTVDGKTNVVYDTVGNTYIFEI